MNPLSPPSSPLQQQSQRSAPVSPTPTSTAASTRARRILVPTTHDLPHVPRRPSPIRRAKSNSSAITSKLIKNQKGTLPDSPSSSSLAVQTPDPWWTPLGKFKFVGNMQLEGYQIHAVQKWVVERRLITTITVYTGDPKDKITVSILELFSELSDDEGQIELDRAIYTLKRDGARPKDVQVGILMVTSLATFRSDYTIVHIPGGNYMEVRDRLYCNINLLRMGCSGRSALTLDYPNETTKDRFIETYSFPTRHRTLDSDAFALTVLSLIRVMQIGLFLFDKYDVSKWRCDGLLCDMTSDGLERWRRDVGEPKLLLEPPDRVADPTLISALLSIVISVRNKLAEMGVQGVKKDPFRHPVSFSRAIALFLQSNWNHHTPAPSRLNLQALNLIDSAYSKSRQNESYFKVRRAIKSKLGDLSRELMPSTSSPAAVYVTSDLATLVDIISTHSTEDIEGAGTLASLWTGRLQSDQRGRRKDLLLEDSSDEEDASGGLLRRGPGRMHRTLEHWRGWEPKLSISTHRSKKSLGNAAPIYSLNSPTMSEGQLLPPMIVTDMDQTSSGPESPLAASTSKAVSREFLLTPVDPRAMENMERLEQARMRDKRHPVSRLTSWADPVTAATEDSFDLSDYKPIRDISYTAGYDVDDGISADGYEENQLRIENLRRRHSFSTLEEVESSRVLPIEHMKVDVDICTQLLISRVRNPLLCDLLEMLELMESLSIEMADVLRENIGDGDAILELLDQKEALLDDIVDFEKNLAKTQQRAETVQYQSQQIATRKLWENVKAHRLAVARVRAQVYPVRDRDLASEERWYNQGKLDHILPLNSRMQFVEDTIDDRRIYVDWRGQTEEEIAEEDAVHNADGSVLLQEGDAIAVEQTEEGKTERREDWAMGWRDWLLSGVKRFEVRLGR